MTKPSPNCTPFSLQDIGDSWQDAPATTQQQTQQNTIDSDCDTETPPGLTCWWDSNTDDDETDSDTTPLKCSRHLLTITTPVENNSDDSNKTPKRKCNIYNTVCSQKTHINKRPNLKHPPTHNLPEPPHVLRLHTNPKGAHTTQSDGPTHADRIPQSYYSDHSNTVPQSMTRPVDPTEGQNTYSSLLVPTQVLTATPSLAPLEIKGLEPVQDSHTRGLQDNVYIGDVIGLTKTTHYHATILPKCKRNQPAHIRKLE